jgi:hypothetical protein
MTHDEKVTWIAIIWFAIIMTILALAGAYRIIADAGICGC